MIFTILNFAVDRDTKVIRPWYLNDEKIINNLYPLLSNDPCTNRYKRVEKCLCTVCVN